MRPPQERQSEFDLRIAGTGTINDVAFDVNGQGHGNTANGKFSFEVTFSKVAQDTDPFANVLGVLILPTGAFGQELENAKGLMTLAQGVFEFSQTIVGEGIHVTSFGNISRSNEREFMWKSRAEGHVHLQKISAIEPFEVVMLPQGPGRLTEVIALPLIDQGRKKLVYAVRHFTFTPVSELQHLQLRHVVVVPRVEGLTVHVETTSAIRPFAGAMTGSGL